MINLMKGITVKDYPQYTIYEDGTCLNHKTFQIMGTTQTREKVVVSLGGPKGNVYSYSRLVADHFIPRPEIVGKQIVRHKDGDCTNYHVNNLYWCRQGEWLVQYHTPEERHAAREMSRDKYMNKPGIRALRAIGCRNWRKTEKGIYTRNRNHWKEYKVTEPEMGWETFWKTVYTETHRCQVCDVVFIDGTGTGKTTPRTRCLDHHHGSGHIRFIACHKCNTGVLKKHDNQIDKVLQELHRYFKLNDV